MKQFGIWMIIFGVGSFLLNMFNMEFRLLMWVDFWGPEIGLLIRIALIGVGIALLVAGIFTEKNATEELENSPTKPME